MYCSIGNTNHVFLKSVSRIQHVRLLAYIGKCQVLSQQVRHPLDLSCGVGEDIDSPAVLLRASYSGTNLASFSETGIWNVSALYANVIGGDRNAQTVARWRCITRLFGDIGGLNNKGSAPVACCAS